MREASAPVEATRVAEPPTAASSGRRLAGYIVSLGSAEMIGRSLTFASGIVVARTLGPEGFGQLALAQSLVLFLASLGEGGLTMWTQRQIVQRPDDLPRLVVQTLVAQLLLAVVAIAALLTIAAAAPLPAGTFALVLAGSPFIVTQALSLLYVLQALEEMRSAGVVKVVVQFTTAISAVVFVVLTRDPLWVVTTLWTGQLAGSALALALVARRGRLRLVAPTARGVRLTLVAGAPILASGVLFHYGHMMDTVVLGLLRSTYEVGIYSGALRLMALAPVLALVVSNAVYPEMVRRHQQSDAALGAFVATASELALRVSMAAAALLSALAPTIIAVLLDDAFAASADVLRVVAFILPAYCYCAVTGHSLVAAGRQRLFLYGLITSATFGTAVLPAATHFFGIVGTAYAAVGIAFTQCAAFAALARGPLGADWLRPLLKETSLGLLVLTSILLLTAFTGYHPLVVVGGWLGAVTAVEAARGWPTLGAAKTIVTRRGTQHERPVP